MFIHLFPRSGIFQFRMVVLLQMGVLSCLGATPNVPAKVKETFSAILALEDIYHNEYLKYAPDLQTLRKHFEVKDSIEYFAPGFEIYAAVRDDQPLLSAIDRNGDSLTQTGKGSIRFSKLDQTDYALDNTLGIDPMKGLQVRLEFLSEVQLKGHLTKGKSICSFELKKVKSLKPELKGCSEYLTSLQTDSGFVLVASLPSGILSGEPWAFRLYPDKKARVKGSYHSEANHPYSIRGTVLPKSPFLIYTRAESRRKN